jgi:hypothetical protein
VLDFISKSAIIENATPIPEIGETAGSPILSIDYLNIVPIRMLDDVADLERSATDGVFDHLLDE